jgi:hypothetical protein
MLTIKDYLNVIEDARIERRQKIRYPGSKRNFALGYKELYDRDFFGIKDKNLNSLSFLDRANIYFKNGTHLNIQFSPEEKILLKKMENTQTFDDVVRLTDEVYGLYATKQANQKPVTTKMELEEDPDSDEEFDFLDPDMDLGESDGESDGESEGENSDSDEEDNVDSKSAKDSTDVEDVETEGESLGDNSEQGKPSENIIPDRSITQEAAEQSSKSIVANSNISYIHVELPHANLNNIVDDFPKFIQESRTHIKTNETGFQAWRSKENDTISFMVKEFEMRKAADTYSRQRVAKTGVINTNKLHSYKYNDDIFRRNTVIPAGKNHGFVMFLDWSGSMSYSIQRAMKQVFSLVLFCKRVNVPFEVYIFRTDYNQVDQFTMPKMNDSFDFGGFRLRNILSSRMNMSQLNEAFRLLWEIARRDGNSPVDHMSGTPLNATILAADQIINDFRKKYKLQIVNTVFITDGGSDLTSLKRNSPSIYDNMIVIRDPVTNKTYMHKSNAHGYKLTTIFLKVLKARTNCNLIGFFITSFIRDAGHMSDPTEFNSKKVIDSWKKYKFVGIKSAGYDEYFLINFQNDRSATILEVDSSMKKNAITKAFTQFAEKKSTNRMMIKTLMDHVATDSVVVE